MKHSGVATIKFDEIRFRRKVSILKASGPVTCVLNDVVGLKMSIFLPRYSANVCSLLFLEVYRLWR